MNRRKDQSLDVIFDRDAERSTTVQYQPNDLRLLDIAANVSRQSAQTWQNVVVNFCLSTTSAIEYRSTLWVTLRAGLGLFLFLVSAATEQNLQGDQY